MTSWLDPLAAFGLFTVSLALAGTLLRSLGRHVRPAAATLRLHGFCMRCGWEGGMSSARPGCPTCGSTRTKVTAT